MVDQHIGYPGSVNAAELAGWLPNVAAAQYSVDGYEDARVLTNSAGDRGITIKAGTVIGDGIMDVFANDTTMNLASSPSGDRWDMIVLRRTWNATAGLSTSVYTIIQGGPNKTLPTRNNNRGVLADQPIALCRVRAGQSAVQEIVDLRVWAHNGGVYAISELVMNYLDQMGTHLTIQGETWIRKMNNVGDPPHWQRTDSVGSIGLASATPAGLSGPAGTNYKAMAESGYPFMMQAGTTVNVSDNSGYARLTFPRAFPNGLLYVSGFNGDDWATGGSMMFASAGSAHNNVFGVAGFGSRTEWVYATLADPRSFLDGWDAGGVTQRVPNKIHRINWLAIGW